MSDLCFSDVVSHTKQVNTQEEQGWKALCSTCGEYKLVTWDEVSCFYLIENEDLEFVASMRAWNCCHEREEPLDGFPDPPSNRIKRAVNI